MNKEFLLKKEDEIKVLVEKLGDAENERFPIYDGINDIDEYLNAKYKIIFILKEAYDGVDGEGGWALRDIVNKGEYKRSRATFYPLIYITYCIQNGFKKYDDIDDITTETFEHMNQYLKGVAHVNINKLPSLNNTRTDFRDIEVAYDYDLKNDQIVLKQIEAYQPDIIVSCGLRDLLLKELELIKDDSTGGFKSNKYPNIVFIRTYHPASINNKEEYVDEVVTIARKWAENNNRI